MHAGRAFKSGYALIPGHTQAVRGSGTRDVGAPRTLTYAEIHPDGTEHARSGRVWSEAERVNGMSAFWVRATHDEQMWCVVRAHRRVGLGRVRGGTYRPGRGRVIEVGEWFTEVHSASPSGRVSAAARARIQLPSVIRVEPLPDVLMAMLSGT